jgi:small subunit ribosomal protein S19
MSRSLWKGPFTQGLILKQVKSAIKNKKNYKAIRIFSRNSVIFPSFVGLQFEIYNGFKFVNLEVKENMIGFKFGEFVFTRKKLKHRIKN